MDDEQLIVVLTEVTVARRNMVATKRGEVHILSDVKERPPKVLVRFV